MSSYNELIKNFEKIRTYMRDFYLFGFKSRDDYQAKSARSYDDERRRLESWLGDHMSFVRTAEGKNVFISIDSRSIKHNPLYNAWKAKSFTDGDVTLHFVIFDILCNSSVKRTTSELMDEIDAYLADFRQPMLLDESTVRKKLKEYCEAGIIVAEKVGRKIYYRRAEDDETHLNDVLHFFSEIAPCGVIGSFLLDKQSAHDDAFSFKHHYITGALDSDVLATLFVAMREQRIVSVSNNNHRKDVPRRSRIVPLRVFASVQNGRQHLLAYVPEGNCFTSYRIDYLSNIKLEEQTPRFCELRQQLDEIQTKMWGVSIKRNSRGEDRLEHVEFTVKVAENEQYIVRRLQREKRVGTVEKLDENIYRFSANVYDSTEMIPWIRTFICRITQLNFSNRNVENQFKKDVDAMCRLYGVKGGEQ